MNQTLEAIANSTGEPVADAETARELCEALDGVLACERGVRRRRASGCPSGPAPREGVMHVFPDPPL